MNSGGRGPIAEMLADRLCPPTRLRGHITDQPAPLRAWDGRAVAALQAHQTLIGIKVGDRAQQQGFACTGWSPDGNTLSRRQAERHWFENIRLKIANLKTGCTRSKRLRFLWHFRPGCRPFKRAGIICDYRRGEY